MIIILKGLMSNNKVTGSFKCRLRIAFSGRVELLRPVVALSAASAAVDLRRRIAQGERFGVVAKVQLGEVEHVAHVLRERGVRPHERHVTFESNE